MVKIDQTRALEIARDYLKAQPFGGEYELERTEARDAGEYWECWFLKKEPARPMHGIVAVKKATGEAVWRPSR